MVKKENEANHVPGSGKAPSVLLVLVLVLVKSIHMRQEIIWQQSGSIPDYPEKKNAPASSVNRRPVWTWQIQASELRWNLGTQLTAAVSSLTSEK